MKIPYNESVAAQIELPHFFMTLIQITIAATSSPRFPLDQRAQGGLFILYDMAKTVFNGQSLTSGQSGCLKFFSAVVALFNIQEFTVLHDHIDVGIILLEQHHLMITVTSRAA